MANSTKTKHANPAIGPLAKPIKVVCGRCHRTWQWEHDAEVHASVAAVHQDSCQACFPDNPNAPLRWCEDADGTRVSHVEWDK